MLLVLVFPARTMLRYFSAVEAQHSPATHYLDCSARVNGDGIQGLPWNSLARVNAFTFNAGDVLLIKRGAVCDGVLAPQGSGTASAPISIDAYGSGPPPVIRGGSAEEALRLFNQQYWEINNLEITGGNRYGVHVSGDHANTTISHIYLRKLDVHSATYTSKKRADSGEVFVSTNGVAETLNDVVIDGVTAHDSRVAEGIFVSAGGAWIEKNGTTQPLGNNVTVQNSTAHDVYGDGILIAELTNGLLQRNVVYRSGLCPDCTGSTPVGLWEWYCHTCMVQYNESFDNLSWGGDGGDFDIDYFNENNIVQYNYGHDSAGYCVAFFGAGGRASTNNVFRFNVCSNNGRKRELAKQGDVYIHSWDQGSLNGVQIYNNTFFWNPASNDAALSADDATYAGNLPVFFKNNIIYSTVGGMIRVPPSFVLDDNIYWTTAASPPVWQVGGGIYTSFSDYQRATREDAQSHYADPMLSDPHYHDVGRPDTAFRLLPRSPAIGAGVDVCSGISGCSMGTQDFWRHTLSAGNGYNIGADQAP